MLQAAADTGTVKISVACHGSSAVHVRWDRRGAVAQACRTVQRAGAVGLSVGCHVFVTTAALAQLDELAATLGAAADQRGDVLGNGRRLRGYTDRADA
ncbi:MAG TPA: hypothetical protein VGH53_02705 [Streptosporangiaceae bacterium]